mgnify:CR=1 FL=1
MVEAGFESRETSVASLAIGFKSRRVHKFCRSQTRERRTSVCSRRDLSPWKSQPRERSERSEQAPRNVFLWFKSRKTLRVFRPSRIHRIRSIPPSSRVARELAPSDHSRGSPREEGERGLGRRSVATSSGGSEPSPRFYQNLVIPKRAWHSTILYPLVTSILDTSSLPISRTIGDGCARRLGSTSARHT